MILRSYLLIVGLTGVGASSCTPSTTTPSTRAAEPLPAGEENLLADSSGLVAPAAPEASEVEKGSRPAESEVANGADLNDANLRLGIDLHGELVAADPTKNVVCSPTSIGLAFAMAWAGARTNTAAQMAATLHLPEPQSQVPAEAGTLLRSLNAPRQGAPLLRVVNRLFAEKEPEYPFLVDYLDLMRKDFDAPVELVDFKQEPEKSRIHINEWVAKRTEDRILDLLPKDSLDEQTRLVVTNAVYFLGKWRTEFDPKRTVRKDFFVEKHKPTQLPMMIQKATLRHAAVEDAEVLELPYAGDELRMLVVLPTATDGLPELERSLSASRLGEWQAALRPKEVRVVLPKFEIRYDVGLKRPLEALGMTLAFSERADFSGLNGHHDLFITEAFHQTFVEVDEAGTEAAAATAVVFSTKSAQKPPEAKEFLVDHPFLFVIRDNRSGAVLFLGRVVDPQAH